MSIKLYNKDCLFETFHHSKLDLQAEGDFKSAVVQSGTWILYTYKNYNKAQPGANASNYRILKQGMKDETVDISSVNGSMDLVPDEEGYMLFEHSYYGGVRKHYQDRCDDVNPDFPHRKGSGVSSAIILSQNQNFLAFPKTNCQGPHQLLKAGKWYATPTEMQFPNDKLQSIKKQ